MHGSLEFMVNNHPTPTAAPEDKGGYLAQLNALKNEWAKFQL